MVSGIHDGTATNLVVHMYILTVTSDVSKVALSLRAEAYTLCAEDCEDPC